MRVAILTGHHIQTTGAASGGLLEQPLCRVVVERVKSECRLRHYAHDLQIVDEFADFDPMSYVHGPDPEDDSYARWYYTHEHDPDDMPMHPREHANRHLREMARKSLNGRIDWCNNQPDIDACVSVHLNASDNPKDDYPLIVYQDGSERSRELGAAIGEAWRNEIFIREDIRLFTPERLGRRLGLLERVRVPTVILEPMFLTNPDVQARIKPPHTDEWVDAYAEGILTGLLMVE